MSGRSRSVSSLPPMHKRQQKERVDRSPHGRSEPVCRRPWSRRPAALRPSLRSTRVPSLRSPTATQTIEPCQTDVDIVSMSDQMDRSLEPELLCLLPQRIMLIPTPDNHDMKVRMCLRDLFGRLKQKPVPLHVSQPSDRPDDDRIGWTTEPFRHASAVSPWPDQIG